MDCAAAAWTYSPHWRTAPPLNRASAAGRVLFSQDRDMLRIAADRLQSGMPFSGLVYAHQLRITVGQAIEQLELLCTVYEPEDIQSDRVPAAVTTEPARVSREPIGHRAH